MDTLPTFVRQHVFSYLHREYDWEKQQVIGELRGKCLGLGEDKDSFIEFVPALLLPTECIWRNEQSKYRCYSQRWAREEDKCTCGFCKAGLWGIY